MVGKRSSKHEEDNHVEGLILFVFDSLYLYYVHSPLSMVGSWHSSVRSGGVHADAAKDKGHPSRLRSKTMTNPARDCCAGHHAPRTAI